MSGGFKTGISEMRKFIMENESRVIKWGAICGIMGLVIFLGVGVLLEQFYWQKLPVKTIGDYLALLGNSPNYQINVAGHLLLGLVFLLFIIAFLGLQHLLVGETSRTSVTVGTLFGIIACPIMVVQMWVQGTVMAKMGKMFVAASDEAQRQSIAVLYKGLRNFDMGIDLAFDTFFFTAWILLALAMLKSKHFSKIFGTIGIVLFSLTALINIWTAPNPPSFDPAPIVTLWVLAVYIQMLRAVKSIKIKEK
jgi:hypothetical protein